MELARFAALRATPAANEGAAARVELEDPVAVALGQVHEAALVDAQAAWNEQLADAFALQVPDGDGLAAVRKFLDAQPGRLGDVHVARTVHGDPLGRPESDRAVSCHTFAPPPAHSPQVPSTLPSGENLYTRSRAYRWRTRCPARPPPRPADCSTRRPRGRQACDHRATTFRRRSTSGCGSAANPRRRLLHWRSTATAYGPSLEPMTPSTCRKSCQAQTGSARQPGPGSAGAGRPGQRRFSGALGPTWATGAASTVSALAASARAHASAPRTRRPARATLNVDETTSDPPWTFASMSTVPGRGGSECVSSASVASRAGAAHEMLQKCFTIAVHAPRTSVARASRRSTR